MAPAAPDEIESLVESAIAGDLLNASAAEVEELLGQELQRQVLARVDSDAPNPEWASATFGPASLARRFLDFHKSAITRQICAGDGSGLKPEFVRLLQPGAAKAGGLSALSATLMAVLHINTAEAAGGAVAVYTGLWMLHADMQQWCHEIPESGTAGLPRE
jgi:hypothetical protein